MGHREPGEAWRESCNRFTMTRSPRQEAGHMRHTLIATCGAIAIVGLTASAQTPRPSTDPSRPEQRAGDAGRPVTVTGCLKAWEGSGDAASPSSSASTPSTAASSATKRYVLTNIEERSGASGTSSTTPPSSASPSASSSSADASPAAKRFILNAGSSVNLSQHVNHKVQVTGTIDTMAHSGATDTPRTGSTPSTPSASDTARHTGEAMKMHSLTVSSLTMIATTCP